MEIKSNIQQLIEKIEAIKAQLGSGGVPPQIPTIGDAMFSAINAGMGQMKFRIFNEGRDANNESLGDYVGPKTKLTKGRSADTKYSIFGPSVMVDKAGEKERKKRKKNFNAAIKENPDGQYTEYEKYRIGKGRQVEYKDLEVEGALRRSIETVEADGKVVVAITNQETAKIAGYQEAQIGKIRGGEPVKIFVFSKEEFEFVKAEGNAGITQILKQLLQL